LKEYVGSVSGSLKIKPFRGLIALNVLYSLATCANAYVFVFARSALHATDETVSSMIMVQLVGQVAGGFLLGRVSKRFGNKPILLIACSFVILLPVFLLLAMKYSAAAALLLFLSSFCMGLKASGDTGIDNYLYSIFKPERIIFSIVARAIFLFPLSFASIAIGGVIEHSSYVPVFVFQLAVSALTMLFVIRMKAVEDVKA
jgi:MFS family permease